MSGLLAGIDPDGTPRLYLTEPSGTHTEWTANAVGKNSSTVKEFLEKNYDKMMENMENAEGAEETISHSSTAHLAIRSLLEVVQTGASSIDVAILTKEPSIAFLSAATIESIIQSIEKEKEAEMERKRRPLIQP